MRSLLAAATLVLMLTACGTDSGEPAPTSEPAEPASAAPAAQEPAASPGPAADDTLESGQESPSPAASPSAPEAASDLLEATPALPEGPYYPSEQDRPSDRDADLLLLTGSPVIASGEPLQLDGKLLDVDGSPVPGATIELWQTDAQGIYMHPEDPRVGARDAYFQSYGQSATGDDGSWGFRTIVPTPYEERPRHLHVKVLVDGNELLTTQIFFAGDAELATDQIAAELGDDLLAVTVAPEPGMDEVGFPIQMASHTLVVDLTPER